MEGGRYIRQEVLTEIGVDGQERLASAKVCVVGCGGLGSIAAPYLAGAGVGELILVDGDKPELSNLHRQVFYTPNETATKAETLARHLKQFNPDIKVIVVSEMLSKANIDRILETADLVLECTDDMLCKYLVNDWCHLQQVPMVYGAIHKFEGYVSVFENQDEKSIHLRDAFPVPDLNVPSCSEVGVMNTIAGLIGLLQANEAIKYIVGLECLVGYLLTYDCLSNNQLKLKLKKAWSGEMSSIYSSESYLSPACAVDREIDTLSLLEDPSKYNLVSILEKQEHRPITDSTVNVPLSSFILAEWECNLTDPSKPTLFYCRMGRRSSVLVEKLLEANPSAQVYSLKGGLMAYKEEY